MRDRARALLHTLLGEGIEAGVFDAERCSMLEGFALDCMHAMDIAGADNAVGGLAASSDSILDFIITDICVKKR